jgi:CRISPR system Cascade subunit CasC
MFPKIEVHQLQGMLGCPNRDDNNQVKTAMLGNVKRARISSQSLNYAANTWMYNEGMVPKEMRGERTRVVWKMVLPLLEAAGKDTEQATAVLKTLLALLVPKTTDGETGYLLFISPLGARNFAAVATKHWQALSKLHATFVENEAAEEAKKKAEKEAAAAAEKSEKSPKAKKAKKAPKEDGKKKDSPILSLGKEVLGETLNTIRKEAKGLFAVGDALNIIGKGRFYADNAEHTNPSGIIQAHALSTNAIRREFDFFTAMDTVAGLSEPQPQRESENDVGAHLGHQSFADSCYYKFEALDFETFFYNAGDDYEVAKKSFMKWLEGFIMAIPAAKRNSFGNCNLPDFVMVVVRTHGINQSLAQAFNSPVEKDVIATSVQKLSNYWDAQGTCFPRQTNVPVYYFSTIVVSNDKWENVVNIDNLLAKVAAALDAAKNT